MSWSKLDDSLSDHPKAIDAGCALALWARALAWCARHHTDGRIPGRVAQSLATCLASDEFVTATPVALRARLVEVGLWEMDGDDYRVHDYSHYHESRAEWSARAKAEADRKRRERGVSGRTKPGQTPDDARTSAGCPPVVQADPTRACTRGRASESESDTEIRDPSPVPSTPDLAPKSPEGTSAQKLRPAVLSPLVSYVLTTWPETETHRGAQRPWVAEPAWIDACPGVDLLAEAKRARAWEMGRPAAKQKRDHVAFLTNWFTSAQERAAKGGGSLFTQPKRATSPAATKEDFDGGPRTL